MSLFTDAIRKLSTRRLLQIEKYATEYEAIQAKQLQNVVKSLQGTSYEKLNGGNTPIHNYSTYRQKIPLIEYENIRPLVEQMMQGKKNVLLSEVCDRFAKSSGTSGGRSKFIPVNKTHLRDCHFRGASDTLWLYLASRPDSEFFATKGLVLGGSSTPIEHTKNILQGDLSSILIEKMPLLGNLARVPSKSILLMDEWNEKMEAIVDSVVNDNVGSLSGVPSWMLVMTKKILEKTNKKNLSEVWPNLEVFFHGGISFEPYREEYKRLIPSDKMQYRETYNASEGFFGIQNDPLDPAFLLMLDYGIFYEFIPFEEVGKKSPTIIPLEEVKTGIVYSMVISSLGGLYRYQIGDTIQFTSTKPYKFLIAGRTAHYINTFGEELMVANTDRAIAIVSKELKCEVVEYTVAPLLLSDLGKGRHEWIIEFSKAPSNLKQFASALDKTLRELNSDYDAKRYSDMTLLPLSLYTARSGFFAEYLSEIGKLGGQHKVPRLQNNRTLFEKLVNRNGIESIP